MGFLSNSLGMEEMQVVGLAIRNGATLDQIMQALDRAKLNTSKQKVLAYLRRWADEQDGVYHENALPESMRD